MSVVRQQLPDGVWSMVRWALATLGGGAVTSGWLTENDLSTIVGAVISILTVAWGIWVRHGTRQVPVEVAKSVDVPTVSAATGKTLPGTAFTG